MIKRLTSICFSLILLLISSACQEDLINKPSEFTFGAPIDVILQTMQPLCDSIIKREIEPKQLPTATKSQTQLDCYGYLFDGQKRKLEMVFADGELDLVWLFTQADEEKKYIDNFKKLYGKPSHELKDATFFLKAGVAVRNDPHELLFISERLKGPYRQWLDSQSGNN